jgi:hypothetical protein
MWGTETEVWLAWFVAIMSIAMLAIPIHLWFRGWPPKPVVTGSRPEPVAAANGTLRVTLGFFWLGVVWSAAIGLFWCVVYRQPDDYFEADTTTWAGLGILMFLAPAILGLPTIVAIAVRAFLISLVGRAGGFIGLFVGVPMAIGGIPALYWLFVSALEGSFAWWITGPILCVDGAGTMTVLLLRRRRPPKVVVPGAPTLPEHLRAKLAQIANAVRAHARPESGWLWLAICALAIVAWRLVLAALGSLSDSEAVDATVDALTLTGYAGIIALGVLGWRRNKVHQ